MQNQMLHVPINGGALQLILFRGCNPQLAGLNDRDALTRGSVDAVPHLDTRGRGELIGLLLLGKRLDVAPFIRCVIDDPRLLCRILLEGQGGNGSHSLIGLLVLRDA